MQVKEALKAEAKRFGFFISGVTCLEPSEHVAVYQQWIAAGRAAGMAYLEEPRAMALRSNPRLVLPEARSVLVVGLPYTHTGPLRSDKNIPQGQIAAYAWGSDYHDVIPPRLRELSAAVERVIEHPIISRAYTDTGAVLERDLAQRAGLGWVGKNTCVIHPQVGSYFFLGELFFDLDLPPDEPFSADYCGNCQRCIQACPTGCIRSDRTLQADECIAYLTIENKGPIPTHLRPKIGDHIFGCDVCQQVCPWNQRFADRSTPDPAFTPRPDLCHLDLRAELRLSPAEFNQKFKGSPVKRAKRRGYLRNICVALGNRCDPADLPVLITCLLEENEALVRGHAAWAIGQLTSADARDALQRALVAEHDAGVIAEIRAALA